MICVGCGRTCPDEEASGWLLFEVALAVPIEPPLFARIQGAESRLAWVPRCDGYCCSPACLVAAGPIAAAYLDGSARSQRRD